MFWGDKRQISLLNKLFELITLLVPKQSEQFTLTSNDINLNLPIPFQRFYTQYICDVMFIHVFIKNRFRQKLCCYLNSFECSYKELRSFQHFWLYLKKNMVSSLTHAFLTDLKGFLGFQQTKLQQTDRRKGEFRPRPHVYISFQNSPVPQYSVRVTIKSCVNM